MREVFPSENNLETSLKLSTTPFCSVLARFQQKLVILSGPGPLQLRFLDRTLTASATSRAHSSPFGGGTCSWIATKPYSYSQTLSFPTNPLASSMFSNIRESSRARFPGSLYLISWSLWVPLQHLSQFRKHSSRDRVKLLVNRTRDLLLLLLIIIIIIFIVIIVITTYYISLRRLQSEYL